MICQFFAPHPALRDFVQKYLLIHFVFDPAKSLPFKPYPAQAEHIMTFTLEGFDQCENPQTGQRHRVIPNAIFGQAVSRVNLYPSPTYKLLRVYFQPGVMFRLFGIPLYEFTGSHIDTESFIGNEVRHIHEQLGNTTTYGQMVGVMDDYLLHKVRRVKTAPHGLDRVANLLRANPNRFSLDYLADQACLSPRQFNRKFNERMGIGPKLYARLARYYQAYQFREANPQIDWLTVALQFGYTDVQHLAKDVKQFAGVAPNLLLKEQTQAPEMVLNLWS